MTYHVLCRGHFRSSRRKLNFHLHRHCALWAIEHRNYMYHQTPDMDSDFVRAWTLIHELSDQLAHNQKMISTLASQAGLLQVRAPNKPKGHFMGYASDISFFLSVGRGWAVCGFEFQSTQIQHGYFQRYVSYSAYDYPRRAIRSIFTRL